ncbi:MAG: TIGR00159 family protein [Acidobacteria bacterium]|jgi:diadenylate cyclase|nr:TIGR00159 family protein [Acidobacteriota bacterium]
MDFIPGFFQSTPVSVRDLVDVALVAYILYRFLLLMKGTRGVQMTFGIVVLLGFYWVIRFYNLTAVEWLLSNILTYIVFAIIVLYQSEIRRALAGIGKTSIWGRNRDRGGSGFDEIVQASTNLASRRIGALIIIEREIGLRNYVESGITLDAVITYDLLVTIFNPNTPLHDGAVIVQKNRILAAGCFLPLTLDPHLSNELGTRHRAAIGITEETDAVAVVVSEETGTISLAIGGNITRNYDGPGLRAALSAAVEGKTEGRGSDPGPKPRREAP